jgi:hypothetical protein
MTVVEFSREIGRRPFQAFTLVTVDGQRFTIDHPEFAATDRRGRVVTFYESDNARHEIDARLIAEVVAANDELPAESPRGSDRVGVEASPRGQCTSRILAAALRRPRR